MRNPTPILHGPSLCVSCRHAHVLKGSTLDQEAVYCSELPSASSRVTFRVTECSSYDDKSRPSLDAMQRIAWELCTDKKSNRIGFFSPQEQRAREDLVRPSYLDPDSL